MADTLDRMLIHRVVVIHIKLHHRHNGRKFRDKRAKQAQLVHAAQTPFRVPVLEHDSQEQFLRLWVGPHFVVDQMQVR